VAELRLSTQRRGASVVVTVKGELDVITSRRLDDCLTQARSQSDQVVVDLSGVDFMDTSSLAVIVNHWKRLTASGGSLLLAGARYRHTKSLWITGLAERLPMYADVDDALAMRQGGTSG
jgi:anti-anti-sigma factor